MCFPIACKHIFSVYLFCSRIKCFVALIRQLLAEHNVCLFFIFGVCTIFSPSRLHSKQSVYLCETFSPSLSFSCPLFVTNSMNARCQEREKKAHRIYVLWTNTKTKTGNYVNQCSQQLRCCVFHVLNLDVVVVDIFVLFSCCWC